jgi:hypothetical protein
VDLNIQSPIRLHGVVLNELSIDRALSLLQNEHAVNDTVTGRGDP